MISDFLAVWPLIFGIDLARYVVTAGFMVLLLFALRRRLAGRKLHLANPGVRQKRHEIAASVRTALLFSLTGFGIFAGRRSGIFESPEIADSGWLYFVCSVLLAIVAQDAYFYWTHRAMHHPKLFRFFHRGHHRSVRPTPWAAYSFDVPEAIVQAAFLPFYLLVVPMNDAAIFLFMTHMIVRNGMAHCGYELLPRRLAESRAWGWMNSVTHHDLHHESFRWNYGLYFTWWDRLMGTEHPKYRTRLRHAGALTFALALLPLHAPGARASDALLGEWATPGFAAKVRIAACREGLCGHIVWLWQPALDTNNPDSALRARPLVGVELLRGFTRGADGAWVGSIYNPEDGQTYEATMRPGPHGELRVRGCAALVFCRTQVWRRPSSVCGAAASQGRYAIVTSGLPL